MLPMELPGFNIQAVHVNNDILEVHACSTAHRSTCPTCHQESNALHGWHERHPQDLPCVGRQLRLNLQVRRFYCLNNACGQKTFVERFSEWLPAYARRTGRLTTLLHQIAREVGGEVGRRVMNWFHVQTSGDTLIRILRKTRHEVSISPRMVGVDDWAIKKGQRYGTILVDLEHQHVIDLLPDREASTLAQWLQQYPMIEILTRDRSTDYASGMTLGAPQARQVADRWHLLLNLRQMAERSLQMLYAELQQLPVSPQHRAALSSPREPFRRTQTDKLVTQRHRQQRLERYERVQGLRDEGFNISQIVRETGLARSTVRNYYHALTFPERKKAKPRPSLLDPYLPYLKQQLQEGVDNALQLFRDIQTMGYTGGSFSVHRWVNRQRTTLAPATVVKYRETALKEPAPAHVLPSARQLAWLIVRDVEHLEQDDLYRLQHIQQHPKIDQLYQLTQRFRYLVKERHVEHLDDWLHDCQHSDLTALNNFARGIQQDYAAVLAALELPWSNGQTEGQVNRLKFIKRQMYGRAKFDLLRIRVVA